MSSPTLRLFPAVSLRASSPPGPMLLLRDFLLGLSVGAAFLPAKAPMSAVMFSWSILADGICDSDFRDFGRVAGRVTSSREDMIARERSTVLLNCDS